MINVTNNNKRWFHKWGYADTEFIVHDDRSVEMTGHRYNLCGYKMYDFIPYLESVVGVTLSSNNLMKELPFQPISPPNINEPFYQALLNKVEKRQISTEDKERLSHSHGQTSVDEVFKVLFDKLTKFVDLVFYPEKEDDIKNIIELAAKYNVCLVPYGGGTNVTNALKLPENEARMIVSVDMSRLNKIEWLDDKNLRVCAQAGITGTDLENHLSVKGYVVGHEPDSVELSTLGGWIATNASGMKKNKYGNIEDIIENFTLVTPTGSHEMKAAFPRLSMGMNPLKMMIGNEGNLGIITKAVLKIHPKPEAKKYQAVLFPDLEHGVKFLKELYFSGKLPASIRLMDNTQFKWGQALNPRLNLFAKWMKKLEKKIVGLKKFDFNKLAVATIVFEGSKKEVNTHEKYLLALAKKYRGLKAGSKNGERGYNLTFAIAYIRELINKLYLLGETFETTVPWSQIQQTYDAIMENAYQKHKEYNLPGRPLICGRITQTYHSAVCMYFTYIICIKDVEKADHIFTEIEHSFRDVILANGGSVSHHHGIGKLRKDFMSDVLPNETINFVREIKTFMDPENIFGIRNNILADIS